MALRDKKCVYKKKVALNQTALYFFCLSFSVKLLVLLLRFIIKTTRIKKSVWFLTKFVEYFFNPLLQRSAESLATVEKYLSVVEETLVNIVKSMAIIEKKCLIDVGKCFTVVVKKYVRYGKIFVHSWTNFLRSSVITNQFLSFFISNIKY